MYIVLILPDLILYRLGQIRYLIYYYVLLLPNKNSLHYMNSDGYNMSISWIDIEIASI